MVTGLWLLLFLRLREAGPAFISYATNERKHVYHTFASQYVIRIWAPEISIGMIILAAGKHHGKRMNHQGYLKRREGDTLTPLPSFNNLASIPAVRDVLSDAAHISVSSNLLFVERDVNVSASLRRRRS
jgi:hypothetical protein